MLEKNSIIIKFEAPAEQTVGVVTKIVGLVQARFFVSIIDSLNLEANPRASKTGAVTDAIQETISEKSELFPFMSKDFFNAVLCQLLGGFYKSHPIIAFEAIYVFSVQMYIFLQGSDVICNTCIA